MSLSRPLQSHEIAALKNIGDELKYSESKEDKEFDRERNLVVYTLENFLKNPELFTLKSIRQYLEKFPKIENFFRYTSALDLFMYPDVIALDAEEETKSTPEVKKELSIPPKYLLTARLQILSSIAKELPKKELHVSALTKLQREDLLLDSVRKNDLVTLWALLKNGVDFNKDIDNPKKNPFSEALENQSVEAMILLLEKKCLIRTYHLSKAIDYLCSFRSPLALLVLDELHKRVAYPSVWHQRAYEGKPEDLKVFTQMTKEDFTVQDFKRISPLHYICASGRIDVLHAYLAHPHLHAAPENMAAVLNDKNNDYMQAPLFWAVYKNHIEMVKVLVEQYKADVNAKAWASLGSLLHVAPSVEMFDLLIKKYQLNVNGKNGDGSTILHAFSRSDFIQGKNTYYLMTQLVELFGADVNAQNEQGYTPLFLAARTSSLPKVNYLLQHEANPLLVNNNGDIAFGHAESKEVAERLYQFGVGKFINVLDEQGFSVLINPCFASTEILLRNGMNPNFMHRDNLNRLHLGLFTKETLECLLLYGANINALNSFGATPLYTAVNRHDVSGVIHLHQHGASLKIPNRDWVLSTSLRLRFLINTIPDEKLNNCAGIYAYLLCQHFLNNELEALPQNLMKAKLLEPRFSELFLALINGFVTPQGIYSAEALAYFDSALALVNADPVSSQIVNFILAKTYLRMAEEHGFNNEFKVRNDDKFSYRKLIDLIRKVASCFSVVGVASYCNGYVELLAMATKLEEMICDGPVLDEKLFPSAQSKQNFQLQKLFQLKPLQLELVKLIPESAVLTDVAYLQYASLLLKLCKPLSLTLSQALTKALIYVEKALEIASNVEIRKEALSTRTMLSQILVLLDEKAKLDPEECVVVYADYNDNADIFAAVKNNDLVKLQELLEEQANPNLRDEKENTPLFYAKAKEIAQCLMENGADANAMNLDDKTPLQSVSSIEVANSLLEHVVSIPSNLIHLMEMEAKTPGAQDTKFFIEKMAAHYAATQQYTQLLKLGLIIEDEGADKDNNPLRYTLLNFVVSQIPIDVVFSEELQTEIKRLRTLLWDSEPSSRFVSFIKSGFSLFTSLNPFPLVDTETDEYSAEIKLDLTL